MRMFLTVTAVAALAFTAPVAAQKYVILGTGTGGVINAANPVPGLSGFAGSTVSFEFHVDTRASVFTPTAAPGGIGQAGVWGGSVSYGQIILQGSGGLQALNRNANDLGNIFLINDTAVPGNANARLDQATLSSGARIFNSALVHSYDLTGPLAPDVFLSNIAFGRTQVATLPTLPGLLTDLSRPDFAALLTAPGTPAFLSMQFRKGAPTAQNQFATLPTQTLSVGNLNFRIFQVAEVPEPASWAMLIAGFGLIGAALRRRRGYVTA